MTTLALAGPATAGWQAKEAVGNARADVECRDEAWFARLYNDTFDTVYTTRGRWSATTQQPRTSSRIRT
ncbi:MAG TPA: hypothetical protein VIK11_07235 [Tepidiformaceae bacterium]